MKVLYLLILFLWGCVFIYLNVTTKIECYTEEENVWKLLLVASPGSVSSAELYSQEDLAHGAGVAVHFPIWAPDGVVLPGAGEFAIPYKLAVFTAQLLSK